MHKVQLCANDMIDHQQLFSEWSSMDPFPIEPLHHPTTPSRIPGVSTCTVQQVPRLAIRPLKIGQKDWRRVRRYTVPAQHVNSSRDQAGFSTRRISRMSLRVVVHAARFSTSPQSKSDPWTLAFLKHLSCDQVRIEKQIPRGFTGSARQDSTQTVNLNRKLVKLITLFY